MAATTTASASHRNEVRLGPGAGTRKDWSLILSEYNSVSPRSRHPVCESALCRLRLFFQPFDLPGMIRIVGDHHADQFLQGDLAALFGMEGAFVEVSGL